MAAADRFEITIQGRGGHGASPHQTKDSIVIGSQLVTNLQQIVSRRVSPVESAVLSVGSFVAHNAFNVIADSAKLIGTVRTFNPEVRDLMEKEMERVIHGTCMANDCTYEFNFVRGYNAVVNHAAETLLLKEAAEHIPEVHEVRETEQHMGGEDFGYYLEEVPGTFFFTGAQPKGEVYPHHHPKFDFEESAMLIAAKTLGAAVIDYQEVD